MKLYLSGGGKESFELEERFADVVDKSKPILYVPVAMYEKDHPYPDCLEWMKKFLSKVSIENIEMVINLNKISVKDVDKYGGLYIGGGNTFKLLKEIKDSGFDKIIKEFMKRDIPISGGSAGAVIYGKTITTSLSADPNKVKLIDFSAFNKLKGYEIWPHYSSNQDQKIMEFRREHNIKKILAISEDAGIQVINKNIEIVGKSAYLFDEPIKREIKKGKCI